jgi:hypothetical protein
VFHRKETGELEKNRFVCILPTHHYFLWWRSENRAMPALDAGMGNIYFGE